MPAGTDDGYVSEGRTSGAFLNAPDAALLGTIPYIDTSVSPPQLPRNYLRSPYETGNGLGGHIARLLAGGGAFTRLFESGDQVRPRSSYAGLADLQTSLVCNAFRGALWLTDVRLYHDGQRAVGASFQWGVQVGGTPFRPQLIHPSLRFIGVQKCLGGHGLVDPPPQIIPEPTGGFVARLRYNFKLGSFADWAGWVFTRQRAPWAWMQLDYGLRFDPAAGGRYDLLPTGSYFPSQHLYVGGQGVPATGQSRPGRAASVAPYHDMLGNHQDSIHAFIVAGTCKPGQQRLRGTPIAGPF